MNSVVGLEPQHEPWLFSMAILIAVASTAISLGFCRRAQRGDGNIRTSWLFAAAIISGLGIWGAAFSHLPVAVPECSNVIRCLAQRICCAFRRCNGRNQLQSCHVRSIPCDPQCRWSDIRAWDCLYAFRRRFGCARADRGRTRYLARGLRLHHHGTAECNCVRKCEHQAINEDDYGRQYGSGACPLRQPKLSARSQPS